MKSVATHQALPHRSIPTSFRLALVRSRRHRRPRPRQGRRQGVLAQDTKRLAELQERLYADDRWALLVVLQGMDTAGKDGVIEHVMSASIRRAARCIRSRRRAQRSSTTISCGARRSACRSGATSASSIAPTTRRCWWCACIPKCSSARSCRPSSSARTSGRALRGYPRLRAASRPQRHRRAQILPCISPRRSNAERLLARLDEPAKRWKFALGDIAERALWDKYMAAYEDMIRAPAGRRRRGTWCRPTTNGSPAWWWRGR